MAGELFGFELRTRRQKVDLPSFAPPKDADDGAVVVSAGGAYGTYVDLDGTVRSEAELVTKYREMSLQPECDAAVDEIVNESMSIDEEHIVSINLEQLKVNDNIKKVITEEFENFDEAIKQANDSEYGLTAGIFSQKKSEVDEFFSKIEAGVTYANRAQSATTGAMVQSQPFVGWKNSGISGKGAGGAYYLTQFLREQTQTICNEQ